MKYLYKINYSSSKKDLILLVRTKNRERKMIKAQNKYVF